MSIASAFAPGRVEILGNHTDYNDGVVLAAALDMGISVKGTRREDDCIRLASEGMPDVHVTEIEPTGSWADYPLGVCQMFRKQGLALAGFEARYTSSLPAGAGLSSSAAMEVSTAALLMRLFGAALSPLEAAKLCQRAENEFVGVSCGLLDQIASVFGRANHLVYLDMRSESVLWVPFPRDARLLIVHSGVKHALTGGEYNERRSQCREAACLLGVPALRDVSMERLEQTVLPELIKRRARHIVGENARVKQAVIALEAGELDVLGELMFQSHQSSIENFENSTPELDTLVEIAREIPGVRGARLTGGGFGGAIVAITDERSVAFAESEFARLSQERLGLEAAVFACRPGDGAMQKPMC